MHAVHIFRAKTSQKNNNGQKRYYITYFDFRKNLLFRMKTISTEHIQEKWAKEPTNQSIDILCVRSVLTVHCLYIATTAASIFQNGIKIVVYIRNRKSEIKEILNQQRDAMLPSFSKCNKLFDLTTPSALHRKTDGTETKEWNIENFIIHITVGRKNSTTWIRITILNRVECENQRVWKTLSDFFSAASFSLHSVEMYSRRILSTLNQNN